MSQDRSCASHLKGHLEGKRDANMLSKETENVIRDWKAYAFLLSVGFGLFVIWQTELWRASDGTSTVALQDITHKDDPTEHIRKRYGLRAISSAEEGQSATKLPDKIFGFTGCSLVTHPGHSPVLYRQSAAGGSNIFEIQKRQDGLLYLVGYATRTHAEQLQGGTRNFDLSVSAQPTKESFSLVEIPLARTMVCAVQPSQGSELNVQLE